MIPFKNWCPLEGAPCDCGDGQPRRCAAAMAKARGLVNEYVDIDEYARRVADKIVNGTKAEEYTPPMLTLTQVKEAVASWDFKQQEELYRWLNVTFRTRMG
jgi:enoyl-CoA hydratase/carnithine racemase